MIDVFFGDDNLPTVIDSTLRFDLVAGAVQPGGPNPMPPIAEYVATYGDVLTTSPTARGAHDTVEMRRLYVPSLIEGINNALSGRRNDADQTKITGTKLAVEGYVNPYDLMAGATRPDVPLVSHALKLVP